MADRFCRTPTQGLCLCLALILLAASCTSSSEAASSIDEPVVAPTATPVLVEEAPSLPTPTPELTATPVPEPTPNPPSLPDPQEVEVDESAHPLGWPIRQDLDIGFEWPETPLPETEQARAAREVELVQRLAGIRQTPLDQLPRELADEAQLLDLELTRLRVDAAEQFAWQWYIDVLEVLNDPVSVTRDEVDSMSARIAPGLSISDFPQRLLIEMVEENHRYLDDEYPPRDLEVVGSVMQGNGVLVTLCGSTSGIWRDLTTDEIVRETTVGQGMALLLIDTVGEELLLRQVDNPFPGDDCRLLTEFPLRS